MVMDYDQLKNKYDNALRRERYWKDRANDELPNQYLDGLIRLAESDPEFKWFVLWLGAGAVAGFMPKDKKEKTDSEVFKESITPDSNIDWAWALASPVSWLAAGGAKTLYESDSGLASLTLPGLAGDIMSGDLTALTMPGLIAKLLGNASAAGTISATALAMIILGRLSQGDNGGLIGKAMMAGGI